MELYITGMMERNNCATNQKPAFVVYTTQNADG